MVFVWVVQVLACNVLAILGIILVLNVLKAIFLIRHHVFSCAQLLNIQTLHLQHVNHVPAPAKLAL